LLIFDVAKSQFFNGFNSSPTPTVGLQFFLPIDLKFSDPHSRPMTITDDVSYISSIVYVPSEKSRAASATVHDR